MVRCAGLNHIVGEVDEQLGEAPFSRSVVAEHVRESGISEGLREALAESLTGSSVVAQPTMEMASVSQGLVRGRLTRTEGSTEQHASAGGQSAARQAGRPCC